MSRCCGFQLDIDLLKGHLIWPGSSPLICIIIITNIYLEDCRRSVKRSYVPFWANFGEMVTKHVLNHETSESRAPHLNIGVDANHTKYPPWPELTLYSSSVAYDGFLHDFYLFSSHFYPLCNSDASERPR